MPGGEIRRAFLFERRMPLYNTFYCDEKLLLDNWLYYGESNLLLKSVLSRSGLSANECAKEYLAYMNNSESFDCGLDYLTNTFSECIREAGDVGLQRYASAVIYKQDIEYIMCAKRDFNISKHQMLMLFGMIFMSRLSHDRYVDISTKSKMKKFVGCFSERISIAQSSSGQWEKRYYSPAGMEQLSDEFKLLNRRELYNACNSIGCVYEYPLYDVPEHAEPAYVFMVTQENNRLCISDVFSKLIDYNVRFCQRCGKQFTANGRRDKYCRECAKQVDAENKRRLARKYRS